MFSTTYPSLNLGIISIKWLSTEAQSNKKFHLCILFFVLRYPQSVSLLCRITLNYTHWELCKRYYNYNANVKQYKFNCFVYVFIITDGGVLSYSLLHACRYVIRLRFNARLQNVSEGGGGSERQNHRTLRYINVTKI